MPPGGGRHVPPPEVPGREPAGPGQAPAAPPLPEQAGGQTWPEGRRQPGRLPARRAGRSRSRGPPAQPGRASRSTCRAPTGAGRRPSPASWPAWPRRRCCSWRSSSPARRRPARRRRPPPAPWASCWPRWCCTAGRRWRPGCSPCERPDDRSPSGGSGVPHAPSSGSSRWGSSPRTPSASSTTSSCTPNSRRSSDQFPRSLVGAVAFILVAVVLAPFFEEIVFRGFLFRGLANSFGWVWARADLGGRLRHRAPAARRVLPARGAGVLPRLVVPAHGVVVGAHRHARRVQRHRRARLGAHRLSGTGGGSSRRRHEAPALSAAEWACAARGSGSRRPEAAQRARPAGCGP